MPRIFLTGDILPADRPHTLGIGPGSQFLKSGGENWLSFFEEFNPKNDFLFGNLEAPLVPESIRNKRNKDAFAGDPAFVKWLKRTGFDLVSIANNHILEFGQEGLLHTVESLQEVGVQPVGLFDGEAGSNLVVVETPSLNVNIPPSVPPITGGKGSKPKRIVDSSLTELPDTMGKDAGTSSIEESDYKIGFAAFNGVHDIRIEESYAELSADNVKRAIAALKSENVDLICLSFHWGNEYIHYPSWQQIELGRLAIDEGADLIIGHHPHVIQPIEKYQKGWIVYSLGNFIFDMKWTKNVRTGMCVELDADRNGITSCTPHAVEIQDDYTPVLKKHDSWLNETLSQNLDKMYELFAKGEQEYENVYHKELKRNRLRSRIGMKRQLTRQWFSIPKEARRKIFKNWFG